MIVLFNLLILHLLAISSLSLINPIAVPIVYIFAFYAINIYRMFFKERREIILITDFNDINDYLTLNLLVKQKIDDNVIFREIIVNKSFDKAKDVRKYLRYLGIKDCDISISIDDGNTFNPNLYSKYHIEAWEGSEAIANLRNDNLHIITTSDLNVLNKVVDSPVYKKNISNIYVFYGLGFNEGHLTEFTNISCNLETLFEKTCETTKFTIFSEIDLSRNMNLDDMFIVNRLKMFTDGYFSFLYHPLTVTYLFRPHLFLKRDYENHKVITYKDNTKNEILRWIDRNMA